MPKNASHDYTLPSDLPAISSFVRTKYREEDRNTPECVELEARCRAMVEAGIAFLRTQTINPDLRLDPRKRHILFGRMPRGVAHQMRRAFNKTLSEASGNCHEGMTDALKALAYIAEKGFKTWLSNYGLRYAIAQDKARITARPKVGTKAARWARRQGIAIEMIGAVFRPPTNQPLSGHRSSHLYSKTLD